MNIRTVSLFGTLTISACGFAGHHDDDALKKLLRALGSQRDVEATLIQVRSMDGHIIRVKTQTVPNRGIRATILRPAIYSGMVSFDDGVTYRLFDPNKNTVVIEKSPANYKFDLAFRKLLIEKNYAIEFESDARVADRQTKVVFMEGLRSGIADRRLFIDKANDMILKYEVMRKGADPEVRINTLQVDLWVKAGSGFEKVAPPSAKVTHPKAPVKIASAKDALSYVSFEPVVPGSLPSGLSKQAMHVVHHRESRFIAVRLSDGMAFVTVYLYPSMHKNQNGDLTKLPESELPLYGQRFAEAKDGLRCWVVGDADEALKERIAKQFIRAYGRTIERNRNKRPAFGCSNNSRVSSTQALFVLE